MPSRLRTFVIRDWSGGINDTADETSIDPRELTEGQNLIYNPTKARVSRGGFKFWSYVGAGVNRSSNLTTRTIEVSINTGITISAGDEIAVWHSGFVNQNYDRRRVVVDSITPSGSNYIIEYTNNSNYTEASTSDNDLRVSLYLNEKIVGMKDFWYFFSGSKLQKRIAITNQGNFYQYGSGGSMEPLTYSGATLALPITHVDFAVLGNKLVITFDGRGNKPVIWDGSGNVETLVNTAYDGTDISADNPAPDIEYMQVFQGRIWATDKDNPDRLHYSDIQNPETWNGEGDSGAIQIDPGDDDSTGISAIFPPLKGRLAVAKNDKLYQIVGEFPFIAAQPISKGIGAPSHFAATGIDQDDVFFVSKKGFHSFAATDKFGDFEGTFISDKIQGEFNDLILTDMEQIRGIYYSSQNAVLWAARGQGAANNNTIYVYNVFPDRAVWFKWVSEVEEVNFSSIELFNDNNKLTLIAGTAEGHLIEYGPDFDYDLIQDSIKLKLKTGIIYVDNDITKVKGFKRLYLLYRVERQNIEFTVRFKIDNHDTQEKTVSRETTSDLLGTTFVLGSSELGSRLILLPDPVEIEGYGRGCTIEIESSQPIELYGYAIDFEFSGDEPERSS